MLELAAVTFSIKPRTGSEGRTLVNNKASLIFTPIQTSIYLLRQEGTTLALLTSHFMTHHYRFSNRWRKAVAVALGIPFEQTFSFSSHNHCVVKLVQSQYSFGADEVDCFLPESELTWEGAEIIRKTVEHIPRLQQSLQPVTLRWAVGHERGISHNRKGRRADGSTYLMREEDRLELGKDFCGDIDDEAPILGFFGKDGSPVAFLTQFTAHPVTAFHCDHPVVHGEFPQTACNTVSRFYENVPTGFLQGCAGDVNSKGLLSHDPPEVNARRAQRYGRQLGSTYLDSFKKAKKSKSDDLRYAWEDVFLPFDRLPSKGWLQDHLRAIETFENDCARNKDAETRTCVGLNFPSNMTVKYRAALIKPLKTWTEWLLDVHAGQAETQPGKGIRLRIAALRIGDVGIIGLPCEPLLGIGRQIKAQSPLPLVLPCGYFNDTCVAYIADQPNARDYDYVSSFYRYTTNLLPLKDPAGDRLAEAGVQLLETLCS